MRQEENTVHFRAVTEENFQAVIDMKRPEGEPFVRPNVYSLAQAWLYRDAGNIHPAAIYSSEELVGFMLLDERLEERSLVLWRLMFPEEHQNRGYGTQSIRQLIRLARESGKYDFMLLNCDPENKIGEHVYRKLGFLPTGEIINGEMTYKLRLADA